MVKVVFPSGKALTLGSWEFPGRMSHLSHPGVGAGVGEGAGCQPVPGP